MHTECMELDLIPHIMMAVEECVPDLKITIHKAIRPPECGHKLNKYYKSMESRYCICPLSIKPMLPMIISYRVVMIGRLVFDHQWLIAHSRCIISASLTKINLNR